MRSLLEKTSAFDADSVRQLLDNTLVIEERHYRAPCQSIAVISFEETRPLSLSRPSVARPTLLVPHVSR